MGGHIRFWVYGGYWFRSYSESLWKSPKVTKGLLPLSFGASLMLGMPSLRSCSVGPPPSAIPGRGRLTRHPCRVAHCAEPALGLSRGRLPPQPPRRPESRPGLFVYAASFAAAFTHSQHVHRSPVGAGLLAMASVQPIQTSTDPPLSPASRLLQLIVFIQTHLHFPCRSQLAGDGVRSVTRSLPDSPLSPASRLLHGIGFTRSKL